MTTTVTDGTVFAASSDFIIEPRGWLGYLNSTDSSRFVMSSISSPSGARFHASWIVVLVLFTFLKNVNQVIASFKHHRWMSDSLPKSWSRRLLRAHWGTCIVIHFCRGGAQGTPLLPGGFYHACLALSSAADITIWLPAELSLINIKLFVHC